MHSSVGELFHDWHDFYLLVGTASATLVGLMFVAASIGASIFNQDRQPAMSAFIGSTVVHFSAVLLICILAAIPSHTWGTFGAVIAAAGLVGLGYSGRIWVQIFIRRSFAVDIVDRLFYGLVPVVGYLLVAIAGFLLLLRLGTAGADLLAAALITLLFAGIHNAWDMMSWMVMRTSATPPNPPSSPSPPSNQAPS